MRPGPARHGVVADGAGLRRLLPADPRQPNCPRCGQHQVLLAAGPGGTRTCGPCAGHPPEFACAGCSGTETTPRRRPCARCAMSQQLHATLADPALGIPAQLQPLLAHFSDAGRPRSVTSWLAGQAGGRLLAELAAIAHRQQITHALLDEQPQTSALHHVRGILVQAGVLPARDEHLERIEPWLGKILAARPAHHAALVRPYATWHVLRRARRRSRGRRALTMSAAGWARGRILAALAFLAWLDDRGTTLGAATQADVDDWLDGATQYRYLLRDSSPGPAPAAWPARSPSRPCPGPSWPGSSPKTAAGSCSAGACTTRSSRSTSGPPERSCCSTASSSHA